MKKLLTAAIFAAGLSVPVTAEEQESVYMAPLGFKSCTFIAEESERLGEVYKVGTEIFAVGYLSAVSLMFYADKESVEYVPDDESVAKVYLAQINLYCAKNPSASYIEAIAASLDAVTKAK